VQFFPIPQLQQVPPSIIPTPSSAASTATGTTFATQYGKGHKITLAHQYANTNATMKMDKGLLRIIFFPMLGHEKPTFLFRIKYQNNANTEL